MPNKSKAKGTRFENKCVELAKLRGLSSRRMWLSDGRTAGYSKDVDVVIDDWLCQCKKRKKLAKWIKPSEDVDIQIVQEDYGKIYVIVDFEDFLDVIKEKNNL